jgi:paraquat-inducible protein B
MSRLHDGQLAERRLPKAVVTKGNRAWAFWLIPLGAAALCLWFFYRDYVASGPLINIYFQNTEGLEAGNTQVEYRGAQIGQVKSIGLTEDGSRVKVTARLAGSAKGLAREGSIFWIVRPEFKVGTISGLNTIVSGEYVTIQPGNGAPTNVFVAAEEAPPLEDSGALLFSIHSAALESLEKNSPIFYRGLQVGEVLACQLANDAREVVVQARVRREYAPLVRLNSMFWNAGGIKIHVGLFRGAEISAESAQTLLSGGIEFATPTEAGAAASNGAVFELNEKPKDAWKSWEPSIPLPLADQAPLNITPAKTPLELK